MIAVMIIILVAAPVLDQLTKLLVDYYMEIGDSIPLIDGVLHITYIRNKGAAFGSMDNMRPVFMIGSVLALIAIAAFLIKKYRTLDNVTKISMSLIIAGGFSNMIDRCFYGDTLFNGSVIDFIDFCAFPAIWSYIFNIADACVVVGTGLLIFAIIMMEVKERKMAKAEKAAASQDIGFIGGEGSESSEDEEKEEE